MGKPSRSLLRRMGRAALLDWRLYEEVEAEPRAMRQALLVVLLASAAGVLGSWLAERPPLRLALDVLEPLVLWVAGSAFAYMVGATFLRGPQTRTDYAEVLRTTGFAFVPQLLRVFTFVPLAVVGFGATVVADLWTVVAGVVAVRQALDFTTLRALGTFGAAYVLLSLALGGLLLAVPAFH